MKQDSPLVSVIVPCFNHAAYVQEAVKSVFEQTYQNVQVIVIDDGSTDTSKKVCSQLAKEFATRNFTYVWQKNQGPSGARNRGLGLVEGKYCAFLDADDFFDRDHIKKMVTYMENNINVDILYCPGRYVGDHERIKTRPQEIWEDATNRNVVSLLLQTNPILIHAAFFKTNIVDNVGTFDESLRYLEDWDFWIRQAIAGRKFAYIDTTTVPYRIHDTNVTQSVIKLSEARVKVLEKMVVFPQLERQYQSIAKRQLTVAALGLASRYLLANDIPNAKKIAQRVKKLHVSSIIFTIFLFAVSVVPRPIFATLLRMLVKNS